MGAQVDRQRRQPPDSSRPTARSSTMRGEIWNGRAQARNHVLACVHRVRQARCVVAFTRSIRTDTWWGMWSPSRFCATGGRTTFRLPLADVDPGSPAARAEVRAGDIGAVARRQADGQLPSTAHPRAEPRRSSPSHAANGASRDRHCCPHRRWPGPSTRATAGLLLAT